MATLTLKGKLVDLTTKPVEDVTNVTVKPRPLTRQAWGRLLPNLGK